MKKYAVIVAGGSGLRMGAFIPKQFLLLKGKPLIWYTLNTFLNAYADLQIILVLPEEHIDRGEEIAKTFEQNSRITITKGGNTRYHSVQNGLKLIQNDSVVFVHDGVRCLISKALIQLCYENALSKGSAIPAVAATDSIRFIGDNDSNSVMDRTKVRLVQTPQTFQSNIILEAYKQSFSESFTDEATVVELFGKKVHLVEGDYNNIKVTRPIDLVIAEKIIEELHYL